MSRCLVVLLSLTALSWTPIPTAVSPEVRLAAPLPVQPAVWSTVAASDGRGFFVASTWFGKCGYEQTGMLLDAHALPALPLNVCIDLAAGERVAIASSGRNYLAVWWQAQGEILGARFTTAGERIDQKPIVIRSGLPKGYVLCYDDVAPDPGTEVDVAWNGTHYVVVGNVAKFEYFGALVGEDGRVIRNDLRTSGNRVAALNGIAVTVNHGWIPDHLFATVVDGNSVFLSFYATGPQIAAGRDGFFVVWRRDGHIYGQELDASGRVRRSEQLIGRGFEPAVGWDGSNWVVAYVASEAQYPLYVVRLGIDPAPVKIDDQWTAYPSIASGGPRALLTWRRSSETRAALIDRTAITPVGPAQRNPGAPSHPALARFGDVTLAAWTETGRYPTVSRLRTQPIRNGVPQTAATLSFPSPRAILDFTSNDSEALLVMASELRIHFMRVAADGTVLSDHSIAARTGPGTVRWTGTQYIFVWRGMVDSQLVEIRAVRISAGGDVIGQPVLLASGDAFEIGGGQLAVAGDRALVVLTSQQTLHQTYTVGGVILSPDLTATAIRPFDFPGGEGSSLEVAGDGADFLVARVRRMQDDILDWQRVRRDGTTAASGQASIAARSQSIPSVRILWTGEHYLTIISREDSLYGVRITPDGSSIDPVATRIPATPGPYTSTVAAALTEFGVDLAYLSANDAAMIRHSVVFRTLGQPRRRIVR